MAAAASAIVPPAPPRLSMTNCWPSASLELGEKDAPDRVGAAGRRIGNDHAHRARRPGGLRGCGAGEEGRGERGTRTLQQAATSGSDAIIHDAPPSFAELGVLTDHINECVVRVQSRPSLAALPGPYSRPWRNPPNSRKGKDPARPTRSKAAREPLAPIAPALEKLLNPGIAKGTAGVGSGTGLKPPPDNSWDRRADFSAAHTARKSTREARGLSCFTLPAPASPLPSPLWGGVGGGGRR